MTRWHVCVTYAVFCLSSAVTGLALCCAGIWFNSHRLGGVGGVLLATGAIVGMLGGMILFMDDNWPVRPTRLTRADRRHLKSERSRIATEAAIHRLEREAGLR